MTTTESKTTYLFR